MIPCRLGGSDAGRTDSEGRKHEYGAADHDAGVVEKRPADGQWDESGRRSGQSTDLPQRRRDPAPVRHEHDHANSGEADETGGAERPETCVELAPDDMPGATVQNLSDESPDVR